MPGLLRSVVLGGAASKAASPVDISVRLRLRLAEYTAKKCFTQGERRTIADNGDGNHHHHWINERYLHVRKERCHAAVAHAKYVPRDVLWSGSLGGFVGVEVKANDEHDEFGVFVFYRTKSLDLVLDGDE